MNFNFVDLSHLLSDTIPTWNGSCGFQHKVLVRHEDCQTACKFKTHQITMLEGIGTHMDAPGHCFPGGQTIEQIPLNQLIAKCVVIDVSNKANEKFVLSVNEIKNFEKTHGPIPTNAFVIIYFGWDQFWTNPSKYRNGLQFPTISKQAAEYLLTKQIAGIGVDTLSPDLEAQGFPVHQLILGAGKYIIENVANAAQMPPQGGYTLALPLKIKGGTESPIRLIGLL